MRKFLVALICAAVGATLCTLDVARADAVQKDDIDIYILVDESSSLSFSDIKREQEAVEGIVSLDLLKKRGIRVGIIPFSSGPSSPRRLENCELVPIDDGNDRVLKDCARYIRRQFGEAGNTDFAAAFKFVAKIVALSNGSSRTSSIILLTDGNYDPDGDLKSSVEERESLDTSLAVLKESNVSIWSLGFGSANQANLDEYSNMASPRINSNCDDVKPNARIVEPEDLIFQLQAIAAEATCTVVDPPTSTPSERFIHPLISTVIIKVNTVDGKEPLLLTEFDGSPCSNAWVNPSDSDLVFQCVVSPKASDSGFWKVTASSGSKATWQLVGDLTIKFDQCPSATSLSLARADGDKINFAGATLWPEIEFDLIDEAGEVVRLLGSEIANADPVDISETTSKLTAGDENYTLRAAVKTTEGIPRLNAISASCVLSTPPTTTTSTTSTTSTIPPPPPCTPGVDCTCEERGDCPPPWLWIFLTTFGLIASGFSFRFWKKSRVFPEGTVLEQQSPLVANSWINEQDISGLRKFALIIGSGDTLLVESYGGGAQYLLSRAGDQVRIQIEGDNEKEFKLEPFGLPIRLEKPTKDGFVAFRIVIPSNEDENQDNF